MCVKWTSDGYNPDYANRSIPTINQHNKIQHFRGGMSTMRVEMPHIIHNEQIVLYNEGKISWLRLEGVLVFDFK